MTSIMICKIAFVVFVLSMDALILRWCTRLSLLEVFELMFYMAAGCLITVGFAAAMLYFVRDVLCK